LSVDSERRRQATDRSEVAQGVRDLITSGLFGVAPSHAFDAYGFAKLLFVGGDVPQPLGPYASESSNLVGAHFYSFGGAAKTVA